MSMLGHDRHEHRADAVAGFPPAVENRRDTPDFHIGRERTSPQVQAKASARSRLEALVGLKQHPAYADVEHLHVHIARKNRDRPVNRQPYSLSALFHETLLARPPRESAETNR